jgi:ABC-2 type transport system permease protein
MNLWRLEVLRLIRPYRIWILVGIFGFFGVLGPLTARFLPEIVDRLGGGAEIVVPDATPELAMAQYLGNALQLGLLAIAFVAALALAFDAKPEMAAFLRTRATIPQILAPRYVVNMVAAAGSFILASAVAFVVTAVMISTPSVTGTILGSLLVGLYLCFVVALTGLFASLVRGVPATALLTVGALVLLSIIGLLPTIGPWLPSDLVGSYDALIAGGGFHYWRGIASAILLSGGAVAFSVYRMERREV